jgi:hypothetical protein
MAAKGSRLVSSADKGHKFNVNRGDVWATYELIDTADG